MFSVQEVDTYTKFKLQEGNLYMNNQRVGIEEFHGGKNIDICNHMFRLKDDLDISGNIIVDEDMIVKGTIFTNAIDMAYFEVENARIPYLENTDISTQHILSDELTVQASNMMTLDSSNLIVNSDHIKINDSITIEKNVERYDTCNNILELIELMRIENLEVFGTITLPAESTTGLIVQGEFIANNSLIVEGVFTSNLRMEALGTNELSGNNILTGTNTLTGTTTIDSLETENGVFDDISVNNLNVLSMCDIFLANDGVLRIRNGTNFDIANIYDWASDSSNNLYYDRGNILIGNVTNYDQDASLNVRGPVDIEGDLDVIGDIKAEILNADNLNLSSDSRLKTNIRDIDNGLDLLRKIKPKVYDKQVGNHSIQESGVLAQDLMEIDELNYLVQTQKKSNMYSVNYNSLHMYSLSAIQQLDKKVDLLTAQIEKSMQLIEQKLNVLYRMRK